MPGQVLRKPSESQLKNKIERSNVTTEELPVKTIALFDKKAQPLIHSPRARQVNGKGTKESRDKDKMNSTQIVSSAVRDASKELANQRTINLG